MNGRGGKWRGLVCVLCVKVPRLLLFPDEELDLSTRGGLADSAPYHALRPHMSKPVRLSGLQV